MMTKMTLAKLALGAVLSLGAMGTAGAVMAQTPATAATTPALPQVVTGTPEARANAAMVVEFYDLAFNAHQPTEAARRFIGDRYIQHNPDVPNGVEPFASYFEGYFKENPQSRSTIHRVIASDDLVAIHAHMQATPEDAGQAIVDIFRVENGKIIQHWDVVQAVPATTANGNTMFQGTKAD